MVELRERLQKEPLTIGVFGAIGVGKTTFSKKLGEVLGIEVVEEKFNENHFLQDFYNDPKRWSFHSQVSFLIDKVNMIKSTDASKSKIFDPDRQMDYLYAKTLWSMGRMETREFKLYERLFYSLGEEIREPDIYFRLDVPFPVLLQRIKQRGRPFEMKMLTDDRDYLSHLVSTVDSFVKEDKSGKILYIDATKDYFSNEIQISGLLAKIKRKI